MVEYDQAFARYDHSITDREDTQMWLARQTQRVHIQREGKGWTGRARAQSHASSTRRGDRRMNQSPRNWDDRAQSAATALRQTICELSSRCRLTPAEESVLVDAVDGVDRATMAATRQISPATLKNHIHSILAKTGFGSLPDLIAELLREHGGLKKIDRA